MCQDCPLFPNRTRAGRSSEFPGSLAGDCRLPALGQLVKGSCPLQATSWAFWSHGGRRLAAKCWVSVFCLESCSGLIAL